MALSDPVLLSAGSASLEFARQSDGRYINSATDLSEPESLIIERTIVPQGSSSYLLKYQLSKMAADYNGKPVKDVLTVHQVIRLPHRSFGESDVLRAQAILEDLSSKYITRVLQGER